MACRHVVGLQWVRPLPVESIPPKAKGHTAPQREGLAYEAKVRKALPHALAGMWFEFSDANGYGRCQPDFLLCKPSGVQIVETKLTYTLAAWEQLFFLYKPVVKCWLRREVAVAQVCKNLAEGAVDTQVGEDLDCGMLLVPWRGAIGALPLSPQHQPWPDGPIDPALRAFYTSATASKGRRNGKTVNRRS